jgi:MFS family permease
MPGVFGGGREDMSGMQAADAGPRRMTAAERKVIIASSAGTVFEWYDFYLAGSLAANISASFFSGVNPTAAFIFTLLGFAAGFAVRPFGAIVFGHFGDLIGRKYTFLITMTVMGLATFTVGLIPTYAAIGIIAPIAFIALRLLQGLALGGEYGGAATYVAEHAPPDRRGYFTSWIQTTATLGLLVSLLVILILRQSMSEDAFNEWGWRIPFLLSVILLGVSLWIRLQLAESPAFQKIKEEGTHSKAPLKEAFGKWENAKIAIFALFGGTAGQAVVWYTGQFYALFFLTQTLKMNGTSAILALALALVIATPFFVVFGRLSDTIGRKKIILTGCLLAALTYFPLFNALSYAVNPALMEAQTSAPVVVIADPDECSFQFNPVGTASFTSSCDIAKSFLARNAVNYANDAAPAGTTAVIRIGDQEIESFDAAAAGDAAADRTAAFNEAATLAIRDHGYPAEANPHDINMPLTIAILTILVLYVTMVYGPIAALLVELFPTRIRYSGMSLPYHIGNGWFGGFLPPTAFAIVAATGDIFSGLWYPVVFALMTAFVGAFLIPETKNRDIYAGD